MRIKLLASISSNGSTYGKGAEVDWLDDDDAKRMIKAGMALAVIDPPPVETAEAKPARKEKAIGRKPHHGV